jgi:hypothetical protein
MPTNRAPLTEARLSAHEEICALRYQNIELKFDSIHTNFTLQFNGSNARLKRIENILIAVSGVLIVGMGSALFMFMTQK